jgi:hypothetical protein
VLLLRLPSPSPARTALECRRRSRDFSSTTEFQSTLIKATRRRTFGYRQAVDRSSHRPSLCSSKQPCLERGLWSLERDRRIDAAFKSGASAALHARTWHRLKSGFPCAPASVLPQHGGGGCATAAYGLYMGQPHSYPHSFARRAAGWLASGGLRSCTALADGDGDRPGPIAIAIAGRGRPSSFADSHRHLASQDENGRSTPAAHAHESTPIRHARCRQSHTHTPYIVVVQAAAYESDGHTCQQSAGIQTTHRRLG